MALDTIVTTVTDPEQLGNAPEEGAYIHGMFLEGAGWEYGESGGYLVN